MIAPLQKRRWILPGLPLAPLSSAFSPTDITGLVAWYDFSDITTLYQDSAKTTPVASDGDPIGYIVDKGPNGYDLLQATSTQKPTYKTAILNGKSVGSGDGGDRLGRTVFTVSATVFSSFFVLIRDSLGRTDDFAGYAVGNDRYRFNTNNTTTFADGGSNLTVTAIGSIPAAAMLFEIHRDSSGNISAFLNGTDITAGTPNTGNSHEIDYLFYENAYLLGDMCEVLFYSSDTVASGDAPALRTYLNDRWAVY